MALDVSSDYLLKSTKSGRRTEGEKVTKPIINKRIKKVIESFAYASSEENYKKELHKQLMTLTSIFWSGIFYNLYMIEQKKEILTSEDYSDIRKKYDLIEKNWKDTEEKYLSWKKYTLND